jgi:hypothetical protein
MTVPSEAAVMHAADNQKAFQSFATEWQEHFLVEHAPLD